MRKEIEEILEYLNLAEESLEQVNKDLYLSRIYFSGMLKKLEELRSLDIAKAIPEQISNKISKTAAKAYMIMDKSQDILLDMVSAEINSDIATWLFPGRADERDYLLKKHLVNEINTKLRTFTAAVRHPVTFQPCLLLAVGSPDGHGRYLLEDRKTKKRSMTSMSLRDLTPIALTADVPRREGVITRRNNKKPDAQ